MGKITTPINQLRSFIKRNGKEKDGFITIKKETLEVGLVHATSSFRSEIIDAYLTGSLQNHLPKEVMNSKQPEEYFEKAFRKSKKHV